MPTTALLYPQVSAGTCVVLAETLSSNTALDAVILQVCLFCLFFYCDAKLIFCVGLFANHAGASCAPVLSQCVLPVCVVNVCTCLQDNPLGALGVQKLLKAVHEGMCLCVGGLLFVRVRLIWTSRPPAPCSCDSPQPIALSASTVNDTQF